MYPDGFQWDDTKNQTNIEKHGIDFLDSTTIFERPTLQALDDRRNYGEDRYNAIGLMDDGTIIHVTYTERDGDIRIISARRANQEEREAYLELVKEHELELEALQEQERDQAEEAERQAREAAEEKERLRQEALDRELEKALQSLKDRQNDQGRNR
jgi:uncharacterized DUF497 family protein